jgi:DnaJ-class molecular chaperone
VRNYHPDRNGGDRSLEAKLRTVIEAYQTLKGARAFA